MSGCASQRACRRGSRGCRARIDGAGTNGTRTEGARTAGTGTPGTPNGTGTLARCGACTEPASTMTTVTATATAHEATARTRRTDLRNLPRPALIRTNAAAAATSPASSCSVPGPAAILSTRARACWVGGAKGGAPRPANRASALAPSAARARNRSRIDMAAEKPSVGRIALHAAQRPAPSEQRPAPSEQRPRYLLGSNPPIWPTFGLVSICA